MKKRERDVGRDPHESTLLPQDLFLDDDDADESRRVVSGVRASVPPRSASILLVDAYPDWLSFVAFILRRRGHDVTCAVRIDDARAILEYDTFDVIVCGLMDGAVGLLRHAKSMGPVHTVALSRDGTDLFGLPRGTVDMPLLRPVPIAALIESVESFLPHSGERLG